MSDTPETNAAEERCIKTGFKTGYVDVEFACNLERERDKARDTVLRLRKQRAITRNFGEQMERERNELRLDQINHENLSMRYMDERDQWRECAEELAKWVRSRASFDLDALEALNEFELLKEGR